MLDTSTRVIFDEDQAAFRETVRRIVGDLDMERHEREGIVEREAWEAAGAAGLLCPGVPEAYGGNRRRGRVSLRIIRVAPVGNPRVSQA